MLLLSWSMIVKSICVCLLYIGASYTSSFLLFLLLSENKLWYTPDCCGNSGSEEQVGPNARAFHVAVAIGCNMFIFGGRSGTKRLALLLEFQIFYMSQ
jgi:hypothetical protein